MIRRAYNHFHQQILHTCHTHPMLTATRCSARVSNSLPLVRTMVYFPEIYLSKCPSHGKDRWDITRLLHLLLAIRKILLDSSTALGLLRVGGLIRKDHLIQLTGLDPLIQNFSSNSDPKVCMVFQRNFQEWSLKFLQHGLTASVLEDITFAYS